MSVVPRILFARLQWPRVAAHTIIIGCQLMSRGLHPSIRPALEATLGHTTRHHGHCAHVRAQQIAVRIGFTSLKDG